MTGDAGSIDDRPAAIALIPARYGSTRLPGKPLLDRTGKPLIQHVVERVRQAKCITRIVIATDDQRIFDAVQRFGGEAIMTRTDHPNGTARITEAVETLEASTASANPKSPVSDIIVNVQGDEPEVEPGLIDQLVRGLANDGDAPMATLGSPFADDEDPRDPNIVKLVVDRHDRALYFSRSLIPFDRDAEGRVMPMKHPGMYAYRRSFLPCYVSLPPTPLEQCEKLEQLRVLEHGYAIAVVRATVRHHGIDTAEQYDEFVKRHGTQQAAR